MLYWSVWWLRLISLTDGVDPWRGPVAGFEKLRWFPYENAWIGMSLLWSLVTAPLVRPW